MGKSIVKLGKSGRGETRSVKLDKNTVVIDNVDNLTTTIMENKQTFYTSFRNFVKIHKITEKQVDDCFGPHYWKRNPFYSNTRCINRLAKHLNMDVRVDTYYPTNTNVLFLVRK